MNVILPAPYFYVSMSGYRAITVDTGDRRGIITVNHPVGVYGSRGSHFTVRGQNGTGTSVRFGLSGRILSIVHNDGTTEVMPKGI